MAFRLRPPTASTRWSTSGLTSNFDDYSPQGYESLGPAYVLVTLRQTARLRGSDQHLVEPLYMLWELAEGKLQETWAYTDKAQALEAAELQE